VSYNGPISFLSLLSKIAVNQALKKEKETTGNEQRLQETIDPETFLTT
jgi:hypothetical protein